ncbi:MAG TPA: alanine racemase [Vicinamibacterales bacterium]|nr:alanine racemase [Vicinamibacterales bacterium]
MPPSRREFLHTAAAAPLGAALAPLPARPQATASLDRWRQRSAATNYEPWLEIDAVALRHNVREIARLAGGRPVLAVVKNNAYGLGLARVGPVIDALAPVGALAVVKPEEALALRAAGVRKPILLMGLADVETGIELASHDIQLSVFTDDASERLTAIARAIKRPVPVHLYVDSGMGRMGIRYDRAAAWIDALARLPQARLEGIFTELAESDTDLEQLDRFASLIRTARARGVRPPRLHAASSHALFFRPESAHLDMVRPGLVLYGAYPAGAQTSRQIELRPAFRLRARVVRVERLQPGDGASYGRNFVAERPTWIATLPVGHADGYPRQAVRGAEVLIGDRLYRVIGAVSASHTIVEVGDERTVHVGDVATLVGPDHSAVAPNTLAERAGISVYDVLMHLSAGLPALTLDASAGHDAQR